MFTASALGGRGGQREDSLNLGLPQRGWLLISVWGPLECALECVCVACVCSMCVPRCVAQHPCSSFVVNPVLSLASVSLSVQWGCGLCQLSVCHQPAGTNEERGCQLFSNLQGARSASGWSPAGPHHHSPCRSFRVKGWKLGSERPMAGGGDGYAYARHAYPGLRGMTRGPCCPQGPRTPTAPGER